MDQQSFNQIKSPPKHLVDYKQITPEAVQEIKKLSKQLKGLRVTHINATSVGGGVAEMLRFIVPLQNDIGLNSKWFVIPPNEKFFTATKEIHNLLQGKKGYFPHELRDAYIRYSHHLAEKLAKIKTDILIIHDPQPVAAFHFLKSPIAKAAIWRCHIDTSQPNKQAWNFFIPFLKGFDHFIFTVPRFTNHDFPHEKVSITSPVIDPLADKNIPMDKDQARLFIQKYGIDTTKPLITQISRFDPWKDPEGVIDAYFLAKKQFPQLQLAMVAQMSVDDPEGAKIYERIKKYIEGEKGIFLLVNLDDNDLAVNAFQVASDIIIQKSIKEGFGLTVTEAMFKGATVIGGNVGGIKLQIDDGKNGFLVNSAAETAQKIVYLLKNPKLKEKIGLAAHESARKKFLVPNKILFYLKLFKQLLPE